MSMVMRYTGLGIGCGAAHVKYGYDILKFRYGERFG